MLLGKIIYYPHLTPLKFCCLGMQGILLLGYWSSNCWNITAYNFASNWSASFLEVAWWFIDQLYHILLWHTRGLIQNPIKHVRWSFFQNYLTIFAKHSILCIWMGFEYVFNTGWISKHIIVREFCENVLIQRFKERLNA